MRTLPPDVKFISAEEALEKARCLNEGSVSKAKLFNTSELLTPLAQYWYAGTFGIGYAKFAGPCLVAPNLTTERLDADFFALIDGRAHAFQVAEVLEEGRRRGAEYRELERHGMRVVHIDPEKGHSEGPRWIREAVEKKVSVRYAGAERLHLVVSANFFARGLEHSALVEATISNRTDFASIWVITADSICTLHSNGEIGAIPMWGTFANQEPEA